MRTPAVLLVERDRPGVEPEPCGLPCILTGIRQPEYSGSGATSWARRICLSYRVGTRPGIEPGPPGHTGRSTCSPAGIPAASRVSKIKLGPTSRDAETGTFNRCSLDGIRPRKLHFDSKRRLPRAYAYCSLSPPERGEGWGEGNALHSLAPPLPAPLLHSEWKRGSQPASREAGGGHFPGGRVAGPRQLPALPCAWLTRPRLRSLRPSGRH